MQYAEVTLDPNETVIAEAGSVIYLEDEISYQIKMGDGSNPNQTFLDSIFSSGKRLLVGESLFLSHFTNNSNQKRKLGFAGNVPGSIIVVDLAKMGGNLICQRDAFLLASYGTSISIEFTKKLGVGLFGGGGFILEKISGDGKVALFAGGQIIKKQLNGESLRVDSGCLVGFTENISYDIEKAGNLGSMVFGGEGLFFAELRGYGTVLLQTTPASRMSEALISNASANASNKEGVGNFGNIFKRL
jgi:uncharacterized protein (TIGR00266 family)